MRLFYFLIMLVLIGAVALPFYMKGPTGQPLMTVDDFVDDSVPSLPTPVYRWQDEHGVWQFGESPPEGVAAEPVNVSPNYTEFEAQWEAEWQARHPDEASPGTGISMPGSGSMPGLGDVYDGAALEKAEAAAQLLEERMDDLKGVMDDIGPTR